MSHPGRTIRSDDGDAGDRGLRSGGGAGALRRGRRREGRRPARAGHRRGAHQLRGGGGAAAARRRHPRPGDRRTATASPASRSSRHTAWPSCWVRRALAGAHRRPVSTPVLAAAVRSVLADAPGMFAPVADHPATEAALVDAYRELSAVDDTALDALARTGRRAADVVRITRRARAVARARVVRRARPHGRRGRRDRSPGFRCSPISARCLCVPPAGAVGAGGGVAAARSPAQIPVTVVAGLTGRSRADAPVRAAVARLGVTVPDVPIDPDAATTRVVSASDPDDEVRAVVRLVIDAVREGVPLERMAVLYGAHRALRPARARAARRRRHRPQRRGGAHARGERAGSGTARSARAPRPRVPAPRRDASARIGAGVLPRTGRARRRAGRPISRVAEIVRGPDQWQRAPRPLRAHAGVRARGRACGHRARSPPRALRGRAWRPPATCRTSSPRWSTTSRSTRPRAGASWRHGPNGSCATTSRPSLGGSSGRKPNARRRRRSRPRSPGSPASTRSRPRPAWRCSAARSSWSSSADLGRVGRLGDGILMGHVALGLGLDLDRVFVCGLAEGLFPTRVRDDSLLPDADRRATDGALPLRAGARRRRPPSPPRGLGERVG